MTKRCTGCGENKELAAFSTHPGGPHGRANKCKDCKRAYDRERYAATAEHKRQQMKAWREANPDYVREAKRKWRASMTDEQREKARRKRVERYYRERDRECERGRQWYLANKEYAHAKASMYRARRRGSIGSHTAEDWLRMCHIWDYRCAYCGIRPETLTKDHVVPLSRGGTDYIGNIVPACHPCNSGKCDRTVTEWRAGIPAMRFRLAT